MTQTIEVMGEAVPLKTEAEDPPRKSRSTALATTERPHLGWRHYRGHWVERHLRRSAQHGFDAGIEDGDHQPRSRIRTLRRRHDHGDDELRHEQFPRQRVRV